MRAQAIDRHRGPAADGEATDERVLRGRRRGFVWSEPNIIYALNLWHAEHLRAPTANLWRKAGPNHPATGTVIKCFGSWNRALHAAGLRHRPRGGSAAGEFRGALRAYAGNDGAGGTCLP
jgi:hypothetical protein